MSKYCRWVLVANLLIRNEKGVPPYVPRFTFDEVETILRNKYAAGTATYSYLKDTKTIKIRDISPAGGNNLILLLSIGDQNAPVPEYENKVTGDVRDIIVAPEEQFTLASHIVIKRTPDGLGHTMMIEKVSGINLSSISAFLRHLFNDPNIMHGYTTPDGQTKTYRPLFEVTGHQSETLREALANGRLEDIEFVSYEEIEAGADEHNYIQEQVRKAKYVIGKRVSTDTVDGLFTQMGNMYRRDGYQKMFVRIKTNSGQTKMTEIEDINGDILSQHFCHNEFINDFTSPIESVYKNINAEIVEKIIEKMP